MKVFQTILKKLEFFSKKYYTKELIKGIILFITLGLVYLFITLFVEYFLWLKPNNRSLLFWLFVLVELILFLRFICFPLAKILGLKKGISAEQASKLIGNHFPEVKDKLLNVLQLEQKSEQSELLVASIEQKSSDLQTVPFAKAVNLKSSIKYLKYALIPLFIWLISLVSGIGNKLNQSFQRVIDFQTAYTPPAPFAYKIINKNFNAVKGKPFHLDFITFGEVVPEEVKIYFNNQEYYTKSYQKRKFQYIFNNVQEPISFFLEANKVRSKTYQIRVINTPLFKDLSVKLNYPSYTKKQSEILANTGNVNVPRGTFLTWNVKATDTDSVAFIYNNNKLFFNQKSKGNFIFKKQALQSKKYSITTSNSNLKDYEQMQFTIEVIKDQAPSIEVRSNIDSIFRGNVAFVGQISDDYGFSSLELVYYDINKPEQALVQPLKLNSENVQNFFCEFPNNIPLKPGVNYELYFQVFDNDKVMGIKKAESQKFVYRQKFKEEIEKELLEEQKSYIDELENSLEINKSNKNELKKIQQELYNKKNITWSDKKNIKDLIKRQELYKQMMQRQAEKLKSNFKEKNALDKLTNRSKEELEKRLEELKKMDKQQKLLDEIKKLADKLKKENLIKKTKELAELNKQQERSLERILEMTKRYYVQQKLNKLAQNINSLANKQKELAKNNSSYIDQDSLNKSYNAFNKELDELKNENNKLKQKFKLPKTDELQNKVKQATKRALKNLKENSINKARENQQKSHKKMKELSDKLQSSINSMSVEMAKENIESLRQILENLVQFSFDQEDLMNNFLDINSTHPNFGVNLKKQHQLKTHFEHIDDSLFTLSMRVPSISAKIQQELANAHYNIDQALENIADNSISTGVANQQYVMTAANTLADMLSNNLDAMQNSQLGFGKEENKNEKSFSLPDLIKKQSELIEQMKKGLKKTKGNQLDKQQKGDEGYSDELYQIYKKQYLLREQLEKHSQNNKNTEAKRVAKKMEDLEKKLIEKGFNIENINKMQQLNYELLKLEKASYEQQTSNERKFKTNFIDYKPNKQQNIKFKKQFYNRIEILNRLSLPLHHDYKKRVNKYFSKTNANTN